MNPVVPDFLLPRYADAIRGLPPGPASLRMLTERFTVHEQDRLRIIYAPFDSINAAARVVIVGITPGLYQAQMAFESVRTALLRSESVEAAGANAKAAASFSGPMRSNLCSMLDAVGLPRALGIVSTAALFAESRPMLHSTSAIRYPVFIDGSNYGGTNPEMRKHPLLLAYLQNVLATELAAISKALVVPLGKAVERAIKYLVWGGLLDERRCLIGLPHPSGGNGHRVRQFNERRDALTTQIEDWRAAAAGS